MGMSSLIWRLSYYPTFNQEYPLGQSVDNSEFPCHVRGGVVVDFRFHLHRGDQNIDTLSPTCTDAALWCAIATAAKASDIAAFSSACSAALGQWWFSYYVNRGAVPGCMADFRAMLCA